MKKLLLHTCCAPCSVHCVESLRSEGIEPVSFWFNPNIHPYQEYKARRDTLRDYAAAIGMELLVREDYGLRDFVRAVAGDIDHRCAHCYTSRMEETARFAAEHGFESFSTTLLVSPYQDHESIRRASEALAEKYGVEFLYRDFRPGFRDGQAKAREAGLYMQKYCGCVFSEEDRYAKQIKRDMEGIGMMYILVVLMGYAFGCLNLAYMLSKARGFDIRTQGSNNAGASNATITMGWKAGVAVGLHDILKSCLAALLAGLLFPGLPYAPALAGVAAVLGHIFPFYLHFRGGKGFASFLGLTLALDWRFFLAILLAVLLITLITDYIVLGTFTTIISFPIYLFFRHTGFLLIAIVCIASAAILAKHFVNIKRLLTGQEIGLRRTMRQKDRV